MATAHGHAWTSRVRPNRRSALLRGLLFVAFKSNLHIGFSSPLGHGQGIARSSECDAHYLEVRNSTVEGSGLGLFVVCEGGGGWVAGGTLLTEYGDRDRLIDSLDSLDYAMGITGRPYMVRWGPRWEGRVPGRLPRGWQAGQMINDAASVRLPQPSPEEGGPLPGMSGLSSAVTEYEQASMARVNMGPPENPQAGRWGMSASRDLSSGEELFIPYGTAYWLNRLLQRSPRHSPLTALLMHVYTSLHQPHLHPDGFWRLLPLDDGREPWPVHSKTGQEADEEQCRQLLTRLGFQGEAERRALARVGLLEAVGHEGAGEGGSSKQLLRRLVGVVVDPYQPGGLGAAGLGAAVSKAEGLEAA